MKCKLCKTVILSEKDLYINIYNIPCCKSSWCVKNLKNQYVKLLGIENFFRTFDLSIRNKNVNSSSFQNLLSRYDNLDVTKLKSLNFRKLRNVPKVYYVETSIGRLIVGINYSYCLKDNGHLMCVFDLNDKKESICNIRNRLNAEFVFYLDIFLKILDGRKRI